VSHHTPVISLHPVADPCPSSCFPCQSSDTHRSRSRTPPHRKRGRHSRSRSRSRSRGGGGGGGGRPWGSRSRSRGRYNNRSRSRTPPRKKSRAELAEEYAKLAEAQRLAQLAAAPAVAQNNPQQLQASRHARRVYVGGLPQSVTEVFLTNYFNQVRGGRVKELRVDLSGVLSGGGGNC
jgi:hypothetical protein